MVYDPKYSKHSPGMFLIIRVIEGLCDRHGSDKVTEVDFGLGDAQYKAVIGNREWQESSVYMTSPPKTTAG